MPSEQPPEPWLAFFNELDSQLSEPVALHCLGGFVVIHVYGVARTTNDCDFIAWIPADSGAELLQLAGRDSPLHQKYRVYLDPVTVANYPDDYETRLAAAGRIDPKVLRARYEKELRGYLSRPEREDLTLNLWIESYWSVD